ncbi:MAG: hypothetical protein Ct9H90mP20_6810 [Candidatus Neomarinimicrobiota bacterium]|nr:MAG: hypothetical protein Ct9H90mP20_6810 [Candidatus Neomarinimicrobiota bacterium]
MNDDEMTGFRSSQFTCEGSSKTWRKILSVNGIKAKEGKELPFQGPLGGEVKVKLGRDGKKMTVKMNRALQTNRGIKKECLAGYQPLMKKIGRIDQRLSKGILS